MNCICFFVTVPRYLGIASIFIFVVSVQYMLQWFGISCICDQYIDITYVIGLVNAWYQILIVARVNRSSLLGELEQIEEVGDYFRSPFFILFIPFSKKTFRNCNILIVAIICVNQGFKHFLQFNSA